MYGKKAELNREGKTALRKLVGGPGGYREKITLSEQKGMTSKKKKRERAGKGRGPSSNPTLGGRNPIRAVKKAFNDKIMGRGGEVTRAEVGCTQRKERGVEVHGLPRKKKVFGKEIAQP